MSRRPDFRRPRTPGLGAARVLAVTTMLAAVLLAARSVLPGDAVALAPVQVLGEVPAPGWYLLEQPTLHHAVRAAGADPRPWPDLPITAGWRVVIEGGQVRLEPSDEDLVFGLPLDLNRAEIEALSALPGVGPVLASAIVSHRSANGFFLSVEQLEQVPGIGPARLDAMRPFVIVSP